MADRGKQIATIKERSIAEQGGLMLIRITKKEVITLTKLKWQHPHEVLHQDNGSKVGMLQN